MIFFARSGRKKRATIATAPKIAVVFYTMIKKPVEYDETTWDARTPRGRKS